MNWLLVCVIGIIVVCILNGYRKGLVRMLFSIATFIVTIFLVRLLAPVGVQAIKGNDAVYNAIKKPVEQVMDQQIDGEIKTEEVLDSCHVTEEVKAGIMSMAERSGITEVSVFTPEVKNIASDCITLKIIDLLTYVILFLIINIGLRVIGVVLDLFSKLPVIKEMNQLGGIVFGAVEGLAVVWIVLLVITAFATTAWGNSCFDMIADSRFLSALYANNIFLVFV